VVSFFTSGQAQTEVPVNSVNVGKPAVVNGEIQVNIASTISALASGSYYLVVSAVGTGGTSSGALSAVFSK
jgi:hypothetical protein